jgi:hypothetical protein
LLALGWSRFRSDGWRSLDERRLRSKDLYEGLVGALLVGVAAAYTDGADELIVHDDG